jgi:hypothetical protein
LPTPNAIAGEHHDRLLPERVLPIGAPYVFGGHLLERVHPGDPHVATERHCLDAVLGLAAPHRPHSGTEAEERLGGLHTERLGGDEVRRLVDDDHQQDADDDDEGSHGSSGDDIDAGAER